MRKDCVSFFSQIKKIILNIYCSYYYIDMFYYIMLLCKIQRSVKLSATLNEGFDEGGKNSHTFYERFFSFSNNN